MGGAAALVMYGMMVGMSVSASRAIGMYVLRMLGVFVGRTYDMLTGVGLLALLLVLQETERLGDVSFLMSFGAVLGICMLTPVFAGNDRKIMSVWKRPVAWWQALERKRGLTGSAGLVRH